MSKTATLANILLNYVCRATTPSALTPYLGLLTNVESATEPSGNNYGRVALSTGNFGNAAASNIIANTAAIAFPQSSGSWGDIVGAGIYDASTVGNLLKKTYLVSGAYYVFTALASVDVLTAPGQGFALNDRVVVLAVTGSSLPAGLTQGTLYYVIPVATDTLQLSATSSGSAINITSNGGGRIAKVIPQTVSTNFIPTFATAALTFREY